MKKKFWHVANDVNKISKSAVLTNNYSCEDYSDWQQLQNKQF